jgi:NAD(P)-dependent dehydrogenase (short-subunit alcohol dehydrogenase family)
VLNLNVLGFFTHAGRRAADVPASRTRCCVNVDSIVGLQGHHPSRPGTIAYNTSKGAVINMTRVLAAEWGPRNIRVNALAPGYFPSKMTAGIVAEHSDSLVDQIPLGKLGGETDLMGSALLLASDAGAHIKGQTIVIDGGATII